MTKPAGRPHAARCRALFCELIVPLGAVARAHGYALAAHGSLARDIDLVAIPWIEAVAPPIELAAAIRAEAQRVFGKVVAQGYSHGRPREYSEAGAPGGKPHGRLCWTFSLELGIYIDLSVMPPQPVATASPPIR